MNIQLTWFGQLRDVAGVAEESVVVAEGTSVADALTAVGRERGGPLQDLLVRDGTLSPTLLVSLDDVQVVDVAGTEVTDGSRLVVMTPISGG